MTVTTSKPPHVNREVEWACALVLLAWGGALLMPGNSFSRPSLSGFAALGTETTWGTVTVGIALARMLALWINGNWHRSPTLRMLTAAVGCGLWAFMASAFSHDGYPGTPTGEFVCIALAMLDAFSGLRSARDRGRNDRRRSSPPGTSPCRPTACSRRPGRRLFPRSP